MEPLTLKQLTDTTDATIHAIDQSKATIVRSSSRVWDPDAGVHKYWLATPERQWLIEVGETAVNMYYMRTPDHILSSAHWPVSHLTLMKLSRLICEFIIGVEYIPVDSRRAMRQIVDTAKVNAAYEYQLGMNHIISGNPVENWDTLDMPDRWDAVVTAAYTTHGSPMGYLWYYRKAGVAFYSFSVYDDVYTETAFDFMSALEVTA